MDQKSIRTLKRWIHNRAMKRRPINNVLAIELLRANGRICPPLSAIIPWRRWPRRRQLQALLIQRIHIRNPGVRNRYPIIRKMSHAQPSLSHWSASVRPRHCDVIAPQALILGLLVPEIKHAHPFLPVVPPLSLVNIPIPWPTNNQSKT